MSEIINPAASMDWFLDRASSIRVLVVGDCMLDAYVSGAASRISPEAPVPVVNVSRRRYVPGGAANVAANARAMGADVALAGITGVDDSGIRLRQELDLRGIGMDALVEDAARTTITKTRITAAGQQIVRFDDEDLAPFPPPLTAQLQAHCEALLDSSQVCVISDYAKGVASEAFCRWLIDAAAHRGVPVVVDPKSRDLSRYRGARVITPNLKEAMEAAASPLGSGADLASVARLLLPRIAPSALLVTRGEGGMSLFENGKQEIHLQALVNEVADVTGAGDTVVSALAIALGIGLSLDRAAEIANIAAGVAVGHHGTWAVRADELREATSRIKPAARAC
ncbi:MAG: PfkB family carbohydrate kinase [Bryobacteraceae bacterium]|jgi:D-beta-D-heptose 7-phosphate kinase/D-beta-D-heptose 1-phosphate adenosyltransferase